METETQQEKIARLERRLRVRQRIVDEWSKKVREAYRELEEAKRAPAFDRGDLVTWGSRADRFLVLTTTATERGYERITNGSKEFTVKRSELTKVGSLIAESNKAAVKPFDWKTRDKTTTLDTRCRRCGEIRGRHQAFQGYCPTGSPVKFAYKIGQIFEPADTNLTTYESPTQRAVRELNRDPNDTVCVVCRNTCGDHRNKDAACPRPIGCSTMFSAFRRYRSPHA